jgi:nucleoside-diphosphate-sugar epimerase
MSKILITGASGFIGTHLIKLFEGCHEMILLSRRQRDSIVKRGIRWLNIDLSEPSDFSKLPDEVDVIIHLAQSEFYRQFPEKAEDIFNVNIQGAFRLLEYARYAKAKLFIFASTGSVYGYGSKEFLETDAVNPADFYGVSKHMGELLLRCYEPFFRTVIFRFFMVYGPGQDKMLIHSLLEKVKKGEIITIEGSPGLRINPIYIGDAIRALDSALHHPVSGVFNVAGDEAVTVRDLVRIIEKVLEKKASLHHTNHQKAGDLVGENSRMKKILNVLPEILLYEGLRKMVKGE